MGVNRSIVTVVLVLASVMVWGSLAYAGAEQRCMMCHDFTTGKNKIGPSLKGILGRVAGTYPGYKYTFTKYIKGKPWVWTVARLRKWDRDSATAVKEFTGNPNAKTKMPIQAFTGLEEDNVITYIKMASSGQPISDRAFASVSCRMCHDFTTGKNKIGPSLKGVLGRVAGTYPGYKYTFTKYIKGKPWVWTEKRLREWDNNSERALKKFTGNPNAKTLMPAQHRAGAAEDQIISFIKITSEIPNKNK